MLFILYTICFKRTKDIIIKIIISFVVVSVLLVISLLSVRAIYVFVVRTKHSIKQPGIDSMETIKIGGINQCLYIRGRDINNPIILFLHGGPGTPEMPLLYTFQYEWEDAFTIVHWDQRGAGKTYFENNAEIVTPTISFKQSVKDAWELTQYLQKRFSQKKIIILGYSWGSVLGNVLVQTYPEAFSAYIGVGQIINGMEGEKIGFEKALDMAYSQKNKNDIFELENIKPYPSVIFDSKKLMKVRQLQIKYNLAVGVETRSALLYFFSPYLTLKDLSYYLINPYDMNKEIVQHIFHKYKISDYGVRYSIPIFYILGENDYQTPTSLAQEYFKKIESPIKKIFILPNGGHATMVDDPRKFTEILKDVVLPIIIQTNYNEPENLPVD